MYDPTRPVGNAMYRYRIEWRKHSYCSEWTELRHDTPVWFLCSEMTGLELCQFIILFEYLLSIGF